jgi:hypothetical protein
MKRLFLAATAMGLVLFGPAFADSVTVRNDEVSFSISSSQMTRVAVKGDKIVSVKSMEGGEGAQLLVQNDQETGDVFLGVDGEASAASYAVYMTTASGQTILAKITTDDGPARNISVLTETKKPVQQKSGAMVTPGYQETIVAFMKVMFRGDTVDGIRCQDMAEAATKTPNFRVYQVRYCVADGVKGRVIQLQNVSKEVQEVKPEQFFVKGVLGVGVTSETVAPTESVQVLVTEENLK